MKLQRNCNHAYDKILKEVLDKDQSFTKLSNDTVRTINDFTGTKIPLNEKGSVVNMCKAWRNQYDLGRLSEIFDSVQSEDYSVERGVQKAGMSISEFEKAMKTAGYKIPTYA